MLLSIKYGRHDEPSHTRRVSSPTANNRMITGGLTYDLTRRISDRTLLLVSERDAHRIFHELSDDLGFSGFKDWVRIRQENRKGNIRTAKGMVLSIDNIDASPHPHNVRAAVHRMGAVPVYSIPNDWTKAVDVDGDGEFEIVVYPQLNSSINSALRVNGDSKRLLLQSYGFRFDTTISKYLEDISGHFYDIEHLLSTRDSLVRCRDIEDVLGESVKSKIKAIYTHAGVRNDSILYPLARYCWKSFSTNIILARHASVFALYMVNQLYAAVGVTDHSAKYAADWNRLPQEHLWCSEEMQNANDQLRPLRKAWNLYIQLRNSKAKNFEEQKAHNLKELTELVEETISDTRLPAWMGNFIGIARFLVSIMPDWQQVPRTHVFVSAQHRSPEVENIIRLIEREAELKKIDIVRFGEANEKGKLIPQIRNQIWKSSLLFGLVPETDTRFDWLLSELEYGIVLRKPVQLLVDDGKEERTSMDARIREQFSRTDFPPLFPADVRVERTRSLGQLQSIGEQLHTKVALRIDPTIGFAAFKATVNPLLDEALEQRARELVLGLVHTLPFPHRQAFGWLITENQHWQSGARISRMLTLHLGESDSQSEKKFRHILQRLKGRTLTINGSAPIPLILQRQQNGTAEYRSNLEVVFKAIGPHFNKHEYESWRNRLAADLR